MGSPEPLAEFSPETKGAAAPARWREAARSAIKSVTAVLAKRGDFFAALLVFLCFQLSGGFVVQAVDKAASAMRMHILQRAPTGDLVVVRIDSPSLHAANTWPWPRDRYATAIRNLREAGADLIAFDIDFSASSDAPSDAALKHAIDAQPGSVILPTFVQLEPGIANTPHTSVGETPIFGNANVQLDGDGRVRSYRTGYEIDGKYQPTIAAVLSGAPYGDTSAFVLDYGIQLDQITQLSFEDVYQGRIDASQVAGRKILIGATALELGDSFSTPVSPATPGIFLHALAFENLSLGRTLARLNRPVTIGLGLIALLFLWPRGNRSNLPKLFMKHAALTGAVVMIPIAVQAIAPVSLDLFVIALAQALCIWGGIRKELKFRSGEIVRQREEHLSHIATHDPETGLLNRRAMLQRIDQLLSEHGGESVQVMVIGIDRFATLRAAIGFSKTNEVVVSFARDMEKTIQDLEVFHLSTSVLGLVFDSSRAAVGLKWIRDGLKEQDTHASIGDQEIDFRVRSGASAADFEGATAERLIERATIALDLARQQNLPHVAFDQSTAIDPKLQLALISDVAQGLELGEFYLDYQPQVSADGLTIVGAEALTRWRHAELGAIHPAQFIPVAEETGIIDRLTMWALDRAIADQAQGRAQGIYLPISINLSARTLCNDHFCETAIRKIQRANADICLEVTETAVIENPQTAMTAIATIKAAGIRISIDDYGDGLSSLMYLKKIAADELKLDKGLLADIETSKRDQTIIRSTIDLAHSLGMEVVAEGIESESMRVLLADLGCDILQGFHIGRPASVSDLMQRMYAETASGDFRPRAPARKLAG